jgi:hypothetical protein
MSSNGVTASRCAPDQGETRSSETLSLPGEPSGLGDTHNTGEGEAP